MTNPITAASVLASHGKWAAMYAAEASKPFARADLDHKVQAAIEEAIRTAVLEGVRIGIETERG